MFLTLEQDTRKVDYKTLRLFSKILKQVQDLIFDFVKNQTDM
jgi:hypothetical protein